MPFVKAHTVVIGVFGLAPASSRAPISARSVQLAQPIPAVPYWCAHRSLTSKAAMLLAVVAWRWGLCGPG